MEKLLEQAKKAMTLAYAPYSHFTVGCALEAENGKIFTGCNVENASYGATLCAERIAISSAVSSGHRKFKRLVLISKNPKPITPCGLCLQVMAEFLTPSTKILCFGFDGESKKTYSFRDLLPHGFTKADL